MISKNSIITGLSFAFLMVACAKMGSLSGGKKDIIPPKLVSSEPEQFAKNFNEKKIQLDFDEFIKLNDVNKQLVISPPLAKAPDILQRNKSIYITLGSNEKLLPNTTYTFYFGNSIQDLNEGNVFKNFEFVFSTGDVIDSLSVKGLINKAIDLKPDKDGLFIMLYNRYEDSIPRKQLPSYITKSDERGWFTLTHMREGKYMVFALKDQNQNYKFDIPSEQIAFSDSLLIINQKNFIPADSVRLDTTKMDSIKKMKFVFKPNIELFSFEEDYKNQKLLKYERTNNRFNLIFERPEHDTIKILPLNFSNLNWKIADKITYGDTLSFWITDTALVRKDTLKVSIQYFKNDSMGIPKVFIDTIVLGNKHKLAVKSKKNQVKGQALMKFESAFMNNVIDLNSTMYFMASSPISLLNEEDFHFFKIEDDKERTNKALKFKLSRDSIQLRKYRLDFTLEPNSSYKFVADSGSITSIYGETIDSTGIEFKTQKDDYYGDVKLTLNNVKESLIVQLLTDKDLIVKEQYTKKDGILLFDYLVPGKYKFRIIYDRNNNKKWDTGNFKNRIQPEKVKYSDKLFDIRSNWEQESTWDL